MKRVNEQMVINECTVKHCIIQKHCINKAELSAKKKIRLNKYEAGQHIFHEGSRVFGTYIIKKGKAKVFNSSQSGNNQIIRIVTDGDMLSYGNFHEKYYRLSSQTLENSEICFIYADAFQKLVAENHSLSLNMIKLYANELSVLEIRQKHLSQLNIKERIAEALLMIRKKTHRHRINNGPTMIRISRQDIADIAGCTVEVAIRTLSSFAKENIIRKEGKKIEILKPDNLYDMLLENCSTNNYNRNSSLPYL